MPLKRAQPSIKQLMQRQINAMQETGEDMAEMQAALDRLSKPAIEAAADLDDFTDHVVPLVDNLENLTGKLVGLTDAIVEGIEYLKTLDLPEEVLELLPTQEQATAMHEEMDIRIDAARERQIARMDKIRKAGCKAIAWAISKLPKTPPTS